MVLREPPLASRRPILRRPGDALTDCPIGTVPILWNNVDLADLRAITSADSVLDEIARVGYEGTQSGNGFPEGDALRTALRDRDLRLAEVYASIPCTVDGPTADALDLTRHRLSLLHDGDGEVLVVALDVSPGRIETAGRAGGADVPRLTDRGWERLAELVATLAGEAKALGHPVAWHQHAGTFVETPAELDRLLGLVDADLLGICLDVGHYVVGGGDPVEAIRRYGARIVHVHLKDIDPTVLDALRGAELGGFLDGIRGRLFTELGAGILDLRAVLSALVRIGYRGWLMVEQDSCWGPPSEAAAIGRRVLAQELRGLGGHQAY
jgi:inosose dehydratase